VTDANLPGRVPTPGEHVDLPTLAEHDEGLLDAALAATVAAHLASCTLCRGRQGRLRTTRALLSALPDDPMPADVSRRVDAALAAAAAGTASSTRPAGTATSTVVPLSGRRARWLTGPAVAGIAASVAVVALVSALVVGHLNGGTTTPKPIAVAAPGVATQRQSTASVKQWQTGTDYTKSTIAGLVPKIVLGSPPPLPAVAGAAPNAGGAAGTSPNTASGLNHSTVPQFTQEQLRSAGPLLACASALNDGTPVTPLAVDYATYDGKPATIIVFPAPANPRLLDVWVVRSVCSSASIDLLFYGVVRPSG
jgi:hypothetical protein